MAINVSKSKHEATYPSDSNLISSYQCLLFIPNSDGHYSLIKAGVKGKKVRQRRRESLSPSVLASA